VARRAERNVKAASAIGISSRLGAGIGGFFWGNSSGEREADVLIEYLARPRLGGPASESKNREGREGGREREGEGEIRKELL